MFGRSLRVAALLALLGASAVAADKLEDVLAKQANLTTFRDLVKVRNEIAGTGCLTDSGLGASSPAVCAQRVYRSDRGPGVA